MPRTEAKLMRGSQTQGDVFVMNQQSHCASSEQHKTCSLPPFLGGQGPTANFLRAVIYTHSLTTESSSVKVFKTTHLKFDFLTECFLEGDRDNLFYLILL